MDNLAHALVGGVLGRAVADRHLPRAALIGMIAANAPDWTEPFIGLRLGGDLADYLVLHRGITHALVSALVQIVALTLLIGLGVRWWSRRSGGGGKPPPWGSLAACVGIALVSHLFMDWQGSYGLRPFLPWNGRWYYGDWVAIVDVFFWLLPLMALAWGSERHWVPLAAVVVTGGLMTVVVVRRAELVATWVLAAYAGLWVLASIGWVRYWFGPVGRRRAAALAVLILALYSAAQGLLVQPRRAEVRQAARQRFGDGAAWAALTVVGHPFTWEAISASRDTVAGDDWRLPRHLDVPVAQRAIRETPEGRAMEQFARFLVAEVDSTAGLTVYVFDARYARSGREDWAALSVSVGRRPRM